MTNILCQIIITLNLLLGPGIILHRHKRFIQRGDYKTTNGVVIIDTDEL